MNFKIDNFEDSLLNGLFNYKVPYPVFTAGTAGKQSGSQFTDYSSVPLYNDSPQTTGKNIGSVNFIDSVTSLNGNSLFGPVSTSTMYEIGIFSVIAEDGKNGLYMYTFQYGSSTFQLSNSVFSSTGEYNYQIMSASKNKIKSTNPINIGAPEYYVPTNSAPIIGSITVSVQENGNRNITFKDLNTDFFSGEIPSSVEYPLYYKIDDFSFNGYQGLTNDYYYPGN